MATHYLYPVAGATLERTREDGTDLGFRFPYPTAARELTAKWAITRHRWSRVKQTEPGGSPDLVLWTKSASGVLGGWIGGLRWRGQGQP